MDPFKKFITSQTGIITSVAVVAVVAVIAVFISTSSKPSNQFVAVTRENLVEAVTAPGTVKAAQSIDLAFLKSGRISSVNVQAGDMVKAGQTLATIDSSDVYAQYQQAKAVLEGQNAKLNALKGGARSEVIGLDQTTISADQSALAQAQQTAISNLQDAYTKADDAIHNKVDALLINGRSQTPSLNFTLNDQALSTSIENDRVSLEVSLAKWQSDLAVAAGNPSVNTDQAIAEGQSTIASVNSFLVEMGTAVNTITTTNNPSLSQTTIDAYKSNITLARTNVSLGNTEIISASAGIDSSRANLSKANQQLVLDQAGGTQNDLDAQQAQVDAAQASVNSYAALLSQGVIRAPIDGVITVQNAHVGQIATPSATMVSMNSSSKFQIESFISEADISKVVPGNQADVTLDAYSGMAPLKAAVIAVDPAATMQNDSPAYKVTLQFNDNDPRIKAGLTANVSISAGSESNALVVPGSAIITQGTSKFVLKQSGSSAVLTPVQVGIEDPSGTTQILSGLNEGDMVAAFGKVTIK